MDNNVTCRPDGTCNQPEISFLKNWPIRNCGPFYLSLSLPYQCNALLEPAHASEHEVGEKIYLYIYADVWELVWIVFFFPWLGVFCVSSFLHMHLRITAKRTTSRKQQSFHYHQCYTREWRGDVLHDDTLFSSIEIELGCQVCLSLSVVLICCGRVIGRVYIDKTS